MLVTGSGLGAGLPAWGEVRDGGDGQQWEFELKGLQCQRTYLMLSPFPSLCLFPPAVALTATLTRP